MRDDSGSTLAESVVVMTIFGVVDVVGAGHVVRVGEDGASRPYGYQPDVVWDAHGERREAGRLSERSAALHQPQQASRPAADA